MRANYNDMIPQGLLFSLRQIEDMGLIKVAMAKKLISKKELIIVKIGAKIHVPRFELIRYIEANTISVAY
jgi:hypothetical protein